MRPLHYLHVGLVKQIHVDAKKATFLCPSCDEVFDAALPLEEVKCPSCDHDSCSYAIHINEGTRKLWIEVESGRRWKRNKKIRKSLQHELRNDRDLTKELDELVDEMFAMFRQQNFDELFPKYREDYARTTGSKKRTHDRKDRQLITTQRKSRKRKRNRKPMKYSKKEKERKKNKTPTKRGAVRGALYEGAFQKMLDLIPNTSRCLETIESPKGERCRPDGWYDMHGLLNIPIEFKTIGSGDFLVNNMQKMLEQSREQGLIAHYANLQKTVDPTDGVSLLIVCSPRDREYANFLIDNRIEGRLSHLRGVKSKKRALREKNKEEAERKRRAAFEKTTSRKKKRSKRASKNSPFEKA